MRTSAKGAPDATKDSVYAKKAIMT